MNGVVVPEGQRRGSERGTPNKVYAAVPANLVAIHYADGEGRMVKAFLYEVGGTFYMPKGSDTFAAGLQELKPGYSEQVAALLAARSNAGAGIPEDDAVSVIASAGVSI